MIRRAADANRGCSSAQRLGWLEIGGLEDDFEALQLIGSMSTLQLAGVLLGMAGLVLLALRLQRAPNDAVNVLLLLPSSVLLILLGAFPSLADLPADALNLGRIPGGRLLTIVVISVVIMWFVLLHVYRRLSHLSGELQALRLGLAVDEFVRLHRAEGLGKSGVLVVMPALNEAENLPVVLARMPKAVGSHPLIPLVVNDGSSDETEAVARSHGAWVASHPISYGGGMAVRTGYRIAHRLDFEYLVTMDADGQHRPEELERLLTPIISQDADLVIGSRQIGSGEHYSTIRLLGVKLFSFALTLLMNKQLTDCASGYRAFRVSRLATLPMSATQYHTAETIILALKHRLNVQEVPITILRRRSGHSKKGPDVLYALNFLRSIVGAWWR